MCRWSPNSLSLFLAWEISSAPDRAGAAEPARGGREGDERGHQDRAQESGGSREAALSAQSHRSRHCLRSVRCGHLSKPSQTHTMHTHNFTHAHPKVNFTFTHTRTHTHTHTHTHTAVLCAACPQQVPFMADESVLSVPGLGKLDYTLKHYMTYANEIQVKAKALNRLGKEKLATSSFIKSQVA